MAEIIVQRGQQAVGQLDTGRRLGIEVGGSLDDLLEQVLAVIPGLLKYRVAREVPKRLDVVWMETLEVLKEILVGLGKVRAVARLVRKRTLGGDPEAGYVLEFLRKTLAQFADDRGRDGLKSWFAWDS